MNDSNVLKDKIVSFYEIFMRDVGASKALNQIDQFSRGRLAGLLLVMRCDPEFVELVRAGNIALGYETDKEYNNAI